VSRALVTGAGGFVGANLVAHLLAAGYEVAAVVRPRGEPWRLVAHRDDIELVECDLEDPTAVEQMAFEHKPDVIFHLAAHGAYSWQQDLGKMLAVNLGSTQALLDATQKLDARLVNAGSSSEYGYKDHAPSEDEIARPNSHYAVTKLAATQLCQLAADKHGVRTPTLRLYSIYGPLEEPGRLIPTLVKAARAGNWPPLVDPSIARDFVWVDDACQAFLLAADVSAAEPGAIFNIASGVQTTLGELVATTAEVFGVTTEPTWGSMEQRAWDTSVWVGEPSRARRELKWQTTTTLPSALTKIGRWFDEHPELQQRYE
jgi:nucleoside-diphosphate-sugar epimerase